MLADYKRITDKIIPRTRKLLVPYLQTLELKIRPGMVTLTWSSMNIGTFTMNLSLNVIMHSELAIFLLKIQTATRTPYSLACIDWKRW